MGSYRPCAGCFLPCAVFPLSDVLPSLAPVPAAGCPLSAVFPAYGVLPVPSAPVCAFPLGGVGAVITYYDENSGTYSEIDVNEDGTYIAPRGQISTSDLSLSFTYSRSPAAKNTKLSYIKVTYNYNWLNLPFFRWQDPTSVSWDDSKFQMTDNSFSKVDKYDGYVIGPNGELLGPYTNQTHSSENGYANASNAGVSWYADLKGYIGVQPTKLYGSGTFKLAPKSTTTSGSTTLYGHYVHPKAELGLSVNVSSYGSFSISGGSNYDERGSQKTISW